MNSGFAIAVWSQDPHDATRRLRPAACEGRLFSDCAACGSPGATPEHLVGQRPFGTRQARPTPATIDAGALGRCEREGRGRRTVLAGLTSFMVLAGGRATLGDGEADFGRDIRIEAATASATELGGSSNVRLRIVNDGEATLHLLGLTTPVAARARLVARVGPSAVRDLESIPIPAHEVLDLGTSHLRLELESLRRPLRPGDTFEASLRLVGGEVGVLIHVHDN